MTAWPAPGVYRTAADAKQADLVDIAARHLVDTIRARRARGWHKTPIREVELLAAALGLDPITLTEKDI